MNATQTAGQRLTYALEAAEHRGDRVPCQDRHEWLSDDAADRADAAHACTRCAVTALCHAAALDKRPSFGVWAGIDWGDPRQRPKRTPSAGAS